MGKTRDKEADFLALIGRVYDAALDETLWPGLAPEIARVFSSTSTCLQVRNSRDGNVQLLSLTDNLELPLMEQYRSYYWQHDLWANRAAELGMSQVFASKDLIADAALERTEYCQDWLRKIGVFYVIGSVFPVAKDEICILGAHRPRAHSTYDEEEKRPVAAFLPHLQRALQIRRRLAGLRMQPHAALDALDRTATATLVITRDGRILYANARGEDLLRSGDALRVLGGRLATTDRVASARLTRAIEGAAETAATGGGSAGTALPIPRNDRLPLGVLVAPFRPAQDGFGASEPAAILFVRDPEHPTPSSSALQSLFGLTPAEAAIAATLADGKSIDEIAAAHGISLNTARTHLKTIFAKTGTSRQAQLVALVLRSVAPMAAR